MNHSFLRSRFRATLDLDDDFRLTVGQVWSTETPADHCPPGLYVGAPICVPSAASLLLGVGAHVLPTLSTCEPRRGSLL
jgi:hypothetical protein